MTIKTSPSILACNFLELEKEIKKAEAAGSTMLHCDVMDGVYVPNMSFGFSIIGAINTITDLPLDVHMMTVVPQKYLAELKKAGADMVTVHCDIMPEFQLAETLREIRRLGMKAAVSVKPKEPAETVFPFVDLCDMILIMTVEPGFGGQKFMADMMPKVRAIRDYCNIHKPDMDIQVDGGIGEGTIAQAAEAGANVFVIGTASFGAPDMGEALRSMTKKAEDAFVK
ncbi:MAG: ribulose-phosphate 3-epimerase [Ruminococcaceae bacterium]|nr:ribulose-phosphate 3-epimerase [Oscillospiraceae bacterium]